MNRHTAVSSFLSDFLGVGTARVLATLCGLATSFVLTYCLGATDAERTANYGVYQLFFRTVGLIGVLGGSGWLAAGVLRYGADEYVQSGSLRKTFTFIAPFFLLANLVLVLCVVLFWDDIRAYFKLTESLSGTRALHLTWAYVIVFNLILILPPFFQASRRMLWYAFLPVAPMLLFLFVLGVYAFAGLRLEPLPAVAWLFTLNVVVMLVGVLRLLPSSLPPQWDRRHAGRILHYSYPILFSGIASQVILSIDQLALNKATNDQSLVGIYAIAQLIYTNVGQLATVLVSLMAPLVVTMLVKGQEGEIDRFVHRIGPQIGWAWAALCGVLMLLSREIIALYPGGFAAGGPILIVLLLALAFRVTTMVDSAVFGAYGLIPSMSFFAVLMAAAQVLSLSWLVPRYGMYGAAWTNCITAVLGTGLRMGWLYYRKGYNTAPSLAPLWPLIVVWPIAFYAESWLVRTLVLPLFLTVHVVYGRTARLFTPDSLEIVDRIRMPERWRRAVHCFYTRMNPTFPP